MADPSVIHEGVFDIQICVPSTMTNQEAQSWINTYSPCGTERGWVVRESEEGDPNYQTRVQCESFPENVHIMLDA